MLVTGTFAFADSYDELSHVDPQMTLRPRRPLQPAVTYTVQVDAGGQERQLTSDSAFDHGPAQWSADDRYLTFHRIALRTAGAAAEVVLWDTAADAPVAAPLTGRSPSWLP